MENKDKYINRILQIAIYYQSSLLNLFGNSVERIYKIKCNCKCKYKHDNRKCEENETEKNNIIQFNGI